jgi:hypothetical protein
VVSQKAERMRRTRVLRRAAAEFVAITAGVLVALTIDSAWNARADRISERQYLGLVVAEARSNVERNQIALAQADSATGRLDRARRIAAMGLPADSAGAFLVSLERATSFVPPNLVSRSVVEDLVSTGNIRLIEDPTLRIAILEADVTIGAWIDIARSSEREVGSELEPMISRRMPPGVITTDRLIDDRPETRVRIRSAAEQIARDPAFEGELFAEYRRIQRVRTVFQRLQAVLERYEQQLEGMVGRDTT